MRDEVKTTGELNRQSILVACGATIGMMTSFPVIGSIGFGLLIVPVTEAFGIGRGTFGLLTGLSLLLGATLTPFAGKAMDRYGVRRLVLPGIAAFGIVQLLFSAMPVSVPFFAALLMVQGAASCLVTPLAYVKVLSLWFHTRRGLMLGMASAIGMGAGRGIFAGLCGALIAAGGWRRVYFGAGLYVLIVGGIIVALLLREPKTVDRANATASEADLPGLSLREAVASLPFRLVMLMEVGTIGAVTIMMGHGPALLAGRGLDLGTAYLGCAAMGSLVGQIVSGVLLDRIDSPKVGLFFALAALVGGVVILHFGTRAAIVLPAAVVMGLGQGAETGLASYYTSRFCGLRAYASIFGLVMALLTVSAGIFPAVAGYVFDKTGSYDTFLPVVDILFALAALAILLMPRYRFNAVAESV